MTTAAAVKEERKERDRAPRTLRLYDAVEALEILDDLIEEYADLIAAKGGDIEAVPAIAELLAFAEESFQGVVQRYGLKIRSVLANAEAMKIEVDRLHGQMQRKKNLADRLKEFLRRNMEVREIRKVETSLVTVRVQANGQASVKCESEGRIEELYAAGSPFIKRKETFELDRDAILAAHAAGEVLPEGIVVHKGSHLRVE